LLWIKRIGKPIPFADAWIAACALRYEVMLVTHNPKHFVEIPGLSLLTEQKGEKP